MYYDGWQTDKDNCDKTPLMLWIEERRGEAIPECLYYDDWQTDKDDIGRTPLLIWFKWRPKEAIP